MSHNLPVQIPSELPPNVRQVRGVVSAFDNGFDFGDGSSAEADVIMYCTGKEEEVISLCILVQLSCKYIFYRMLQAETFPVIILYSFKHSLILTLLLKYSFTSVCSFNSI